MIAELMAVNAAYAVIKTTVQNSGEIMSAASHIADFFKNKTQIQEKLADKRQQGKETSDLEEFFALEEIKQKEQELKELMIYCGRPGLWDDWLKFQVEARHRREEAERERIAEELAKKKKFANKVQTFLLSFWLSVLGALIGFIIWFVVYLKDFK
jgi:hypothetical protein